VEATSLRPLGPGTAIVPHKRPSDGDQMRAGHRTLTLRLAFALAAAFGCLLVVEPAARADDVSSSNPEVRVTTNMGSFVIELRPDRAPLTVADFLRYV